MELALKNHFKNDAVIENNVSEKNIDDDRKSTKLLFSEKYYLDEILGTGGFSVVKKCRNKETEKQYAAKIIEVKNLNQKQRKEIELEVKICLKLQHLSIVRLFEFYPETNFHCLIFELVTGGELFDDLVERERYSEMDASECIQQILEAISYCHSKGIIHRDIKPENLLLANKDPDAKIKLTDFGLAVEEGNTPKWHGLAGTPSYVAPEVVKRQPYDVAVDCWACGCMLYLMLVGYPPFWNSDRKTLFDTIKDGVYDFDSDSWKTISFEAKSLIRSLLTVNVKRRSSASKALCSSWINKRQTVASKHHRKNTLNRLKVFNARRKFKGAIRTTLLATGQGFKSRKSVA